MKGLVIAGLMVVLLVVSGGGAYLFLLQSHSQAGVTSAAQSSSSSATFISISQTQSISTTTSSSHVVQTTNGPAKVNVSALTCIAANGRCTMTLVNMGGTGVEATGCTFNGQTGVFSPLGGQIASGGSLDVSCGPAQGGAVPIPRFHLEGFIQLSDGSSVKYSGNWQ